MTWAFSGERADSRAPAPFVEVPFVSAVISVHTLAGVRAVVTGDGVAGRRQALDGGPDGAVGRAPAEDQQVAAVWPEDLERRDVPGDACHLGLTIELHPMVVVRVVADVAGHIGLLEATDAMLEPGRARHSPWPRERVRIALIRPVRGRIRCVLDSDPRQVVIRRDPPRLRAGRQEG